MEEKKGRAVVLVNPRATYAEEVSQKCYPPLHLLYLAASLEAAGFAPVVVDANAQALPDAAIAARAASSRPFLLGVSVYSDILPHAAALSRALKNALPDARLVLGGPHATSAPEKTLAQIPEADFVLTGEAEHSLVALALALQDGSAFTEIPGLWRRENGRAVSGPPHVFPDPKNLPRPARGLVQDVYDARLYHSLLVRRRPVDTLLTSRGCPFSCGFCYNFRKKYRARDPWDVVEELLSIRERGIRDVEIADDTFTADEGRAMDILGLIIKERLGVSFRIKSRVDVFTERLAARAREAGVYLVAFGMESGSQRMLNAMGKRITLEMSARARELCRENGFACHSSWVVGYPGETPETALATERFILAIKPTTANVAALRPYPGTPVYLEAEAAGTLAGDWAPDMEEYPWVRLPWTRTRADLEGLVRRMTRRVYFRPHYAWGFGRMIVEGANWMLARYAVQEAGKVLFPGRGREVLR
jgi:radical SAM superfamily enzyme YgiQ (UPF0313 family)